MKEDPAEVWVVLYNQDDGAFWLQTKVRQSSRYQIVCMGNMLFTHAFVDWASKHFNLSNQPDKPFDYAGEKPPHADILKAYELFLSIYTAIERRSKLIV